jgi:KDO2-lipid IV(A) lauroyltransferase
MIEPSAGGMRERTEAWAFAVVLWLLRRLPLDAASAFMGAVARAIGPHLRRSDVARRNLGLALPGAGNAELERIVRGMWDHLGRTVGEVAHLGELDCYGGGRIEAIGVEHLDAFRDGDRGGIVFSGHMGWWDLVALSLVQRGLDVTIVWRVINNPYIRRMMLKARGAVGAYVPKGPGAAREMIAGLNAGRHFGLLIDQKMNDGISVPFFGRDAMTAPAMAQFAVRDGTPLLPVRCERLEGARFRLTFYPPLEAVVTGDRQRDVAATMAKANALLEAWIRERPEQWLWIHNRWPD